MRPTRRVEQYGDLPRQRGEWWLPDQPGPRPTVVLVHGGYWRDGYDLTLEDRVAHDLAARGYLVWNVDYRPSSAGWPATLEDAAAAYDHLVTSERADPGRISLVGHSAGGHLALWLAARHLLPDGAPGAGPRAPRPTAVVAQAPIAALADGARARLGDGGDAVQALVGGEPDEVPERYAVADPVQLLPTGVRTTCVHASDDTVVPLWQSESLGAAADLVVIGTGHFEHLDPASAACAAMREALA